MACPRCDTTLERYTLAGAEAVVCEQCGYIGAPVDHRSEPVEAESWDDVLAHTETAGAVDSIESAPSITTIADTGGDTTDTHTDTDTDAQPAGYAGVLCPDCGERFNSQHGPATHRGLVHE